MKLPFLHTLWKLPFQIRPLISLSDSTNITEQDNGSLKRCHNRIIVFTTYSKNSHYFPHVSSSVTPSCGRWRRDLSRRTRVASANLCRDSEIKLQSQGTGLQNKKGSRRNLTVLLIIIFFQFSCYSNSQMLGKAYTTEIQFGWEAGCLRSRCQHFQIILTVILQVAEYHFCVLISWKR